MRVRVYACTRVCTYACMRVYMYFCMRACVHACMHFRYACKQASLSPPRHPLPAHTPATLNPTLCTLVLTPAPRTLHPARKNKTSTCREQGEHAPICVLATCHHPSSLTILCVGVYSKCLVCVYAGCVYMFNVCILGLCVSCARCRVYECEDDSSVVCAPGLLFLGDPETSMK